MTTLIFPGNVIENKDWAYEVREKVFNDSTDVIVFEYEHWKNGTGFIDLDVEKEKLRNLGLGKVNVFAKSVGTLLTFVSYKDKILSVEKAMFLGIPGGLFRRLEIDLEAEIKMFEVETVCLQNEFDPTMSCKELMERVEASQNSKWEVVCGTGEKRHHYSNYNLIRTCWKNLLSRENN